MASKYDGLGDHLAALGDDAITLTFAEVEAIVGPLPPYARRAREWWGASAKGRFQYAHAAHWWRLGYAADRPDFAAGSVTFRRVAQGGWMPRGEKARGIPSRYQPLVDHLAAATGDEVVLTFARIEALIGGPVPISARVHAGYWAGANTPPARLLGAAGWRGTIERSRTRVRFVRVRDGRGG